MSPLNKTALITVITATAFVHGVNADTTTNNSSDMSQHPLMEKAENIGHEAKAFFDNGLREGKLETAMLFNQHLNNFEINSQVDGDTATLTGTVDSAIKKDLAEQIALSVEGINHVKNQLMIDNLPEKSAEQQAETTNKFVQSVTDASITAEVKMKLLVNKNLQGMSIDVDTENNVVTLNGEVGSSAESALAEAIAANQNEVIKVKNKLRVHS